jgi:hypothetical protein
LRWARFCPVCNSLGEHSTASTFLRGQKSTSLLDDIALPPWNASTAFFRRVECATRKAAPATTC